MTVVSTELPNDVEALRRLVVQLQFENKQLRAALFARRSEKFDPEDALQSRLFNELEVELAKGPELFTESETVAPVAGGAKKKPNGSSQTEKVPAEVPREIILHDIPEHAKRCGCGAELIRIGAEESEKVDIIPPRLRVELHVRPKYACRVCEGAGDEEHPAVRVAPPAPSLWPKSLLSVRAITYCIISKFMDAVPFYRQEGILGRYGIRVSRATLAGYAMRLLDNRNFQRLLALLRRELTRGPWLGVDETRLKVLHARRQNAYMWAFRGGGARPVLWYAYRQTRSPAFLGAFLRRYRGPVLTDGYPAYDSVFKDPGRLEQITHAGCWAHVRRPFFELYRQAPDSAAARYALGQIRLLYQIERTGRKRGLDAEGLRALRQEHARPLIDEFKQWLDRMAPATPPAGPLGKPVFYALAQWPKLVMYLDDGNIPIDNNLVENAIRPFVIGRKNWLFSVAVQGARASAALYTLIENAKANGLDPFRYLFHVFEALATPKSRAQLTALLPQFIDSAVLTDES